MKQFLREALWPVVTFTGMTLALEYGIVLAFMFGLLVPPLHQSNEGGLSMAVSHALIIGFALLVGIVSGLALTVLRQGLRLIGIR